MKENNKYGIIAIVIFSTIFGLIAGGVGSIAVKSFFGTGSTFWGELNFVEGNLEKPRVVISGAKKVVVQQDEKLSETIASVEESLVGIYDKIEKPIEDGFNINSFYKRGESVGLGLIVTSDGWLMTDEIDILSLSQADPEKGLSEYVIIDSKNNIFEIEKFALDEKSGYVFLKINTRDLPVLEISSKNELNLGETTFAVNKLGDIFLNTVSSIYDVRDFYSVSSDYFYNKINLANEMGENFKSSFIFDISGKLVLTENKDGEIIPARAFNRAIESVFEEEFISRPSLGLVYSDLAYYVGDSANEYFDMRGALVNPQPSSVLSPWIDAGIEVGDIIRYVDGVELSSENSLVSLIMDYSPGDKIQIGLLRDTEEIELSVLLSELK
ncbi:hypothetical protein C0584_01125 [Candidatus Parcubacteria bacterium]|nr:MAG: hypothetical protein C0584_01125 [Candidatus Parcubacteria bacterium]